VPRATSPSPRKLCALRQDRLNLSSRRLNVSSRRLNVSSRRLDSSPPRCGTAAVPDQVHAPRVAMLSEQVRENRAQVLAVVVLDAPAVHLAGVDDKCHHEVHGPVPDVLETPGTRSRRAQPGSRHVRSTRGSLQPSFQSQHRSSASSSTASDEVAARPHARSPEPLCLARSVEEGPIIEVSTRAWMTPTPA
jgi:hypothetical protein